MDRWAPRDNSSRGSPNGAMRRSCTVVPGNSPSSNKRRRKLGSPPTRTMVTELPMVTWLSGTNGDLVQPNTKFNLGACSRRQAGWIAPNDENPCLAHRTDKNTAPRLLGGMAYAADLKSAAERRPGSTPGGATRQNRLVTFLRRPFGAKRTRAPQPCPAASTAACRACLPGATIGCFRGG